MPQKPARRNADVPLPREFYLRPTLTVARDLLGKLLVRNVDGMRMSGRIVEVEAYLGANDPAAHTFRGKTKRNEVMFKTGGHLYVYFTYGMHYCANIVTEEEGTGHACLIRAIEPIDGIEEMRRRRNVARDVDLTNGPAKLCAALGIDTEQNGIDLCGGEIYLCDAPAVARSQIISSPRIGISKATEEMWRFAVKGNVFVSR